MACKIILTIKGELKGDKLISEDGIIYKIYYKPFYPKLGYYKIRKINDGIYYIIDFVKMQ